MTKRELPETLRSTVDDVKPVGLRRVTRRREIAYPQNRQGIQVVTDARRTNDGVGFQSVYFSVLPTGTDVRMLWSGREVSQEQAADAIQARLAGEYRKGNMDAVLLTGGEHLHPRTTGTYHQADETELNKYGGYDLVRDTVDGQMMLFAESRRIPVIAICRGSQLMVNVYSGGLAKPDDHGQFEHTFIPSPNGPILQQHPVRDVLPEALRAVVDIAPPIIHEVNSAHAQGYRVCDISSQAMEKLHESGWYPWLVADVAGVKSDQQVIEGWVRVTHGRVVGVATQFHPERQQDEDGLRVRAFMQEVVLANKQPRYRKLLRRFHLAQ